MNPHLLELLRTLGKWALILLAEFNLLIGALLICWYLVGKNRRSEDADC